MNESIKLILLAFHLGSVGVYVGGLFYLQLFIKKETLKEESKQIARASQWMLLLTLMTGIGLLSLGLDRLTGPNLHLLGTKLLLLILLGVVGMVYSVRLRRGLMKWMSFLSWAQIILLFVAMFHGLLLRGRIVGL